MCPNKEKNQLWRKPYEALYLGLPSLHNINSYKCKWQNCPDVNERMVQKLKSIFLKVTLHKLKPKTLIVQV